MLDVPSSYSQRKEPIPPMKPLPPIKVVENVCTSVNDSAEHSLAALVEGVRKVEKVDDFIKTTEVIALIGHKGSGKSLLGNYLRGFEMTLVSSKSLGLTSLRPLIELKTKQPEAFEIRHVQRRAQTAPRMAVDETRGWTYADCPSFCEEGAVEECGVSAVNLTSFLTQAAKVKFIVLVSYDSLLADKARGFAATIQGFCELLGSTKNVIVFKNSFLFGITHIPRQTADKRPLKDLKDWIQETVSQDPVTKELFHVISERCFIYDPLDKGHLEYAGEWKREDFWKALQSMTPLQNPSHFLKIVIAPEVEKKFREMFGSIISKVHDLLKRSSVKSVDYATLGEYESKSEPLKRIAHPLVSRFIEDLHAPILDHFKALIKEFNLACSQDTIEGLQSARSQLQHISQALQLFSKPLRDKITLLFEGQNTSPFKEPALNAMQQALVFHFKQNRRMQDVITAAQHERDLLRDRLQNSLDEFEQQKEKFRASLYRLVKTLRQEIEQGTVPAERLAQLYEMILFASSTFETICSTVFQYIELEKKGNEVKWKAFKAPLELALYSRKKELEFILAQIDAVNMSQEAEWNIFLQLHAQKVQEEAVKFDEVLQMTAFKKQAESEALEQELKSFKLNTETLKKNNQLLNDAKAIYTRHQAKLCQLHLQGLQAQYALDVDMRQEIADFFIKWK